MNKALLEYKYRLRLTIVGNNRRSASVRAFPSRKRVRQKPGLLGNFRGTCSGTVYRCLRYWSSSRPLLKMRTASWSLYPLLLAQRTQKFWTKGSRSYCMPRVLKCRLPWVQDGQCGLWTRSSPLGALNERRMPFLGLAGVWRDRKAVVGYCAITQLST